MNFEEERREDRLRREARRYSIKLGIGLVVLALVLFSILLFINYAFVVPNIQMNQEQEKVVQTDGLTVETTQSAVVNHSLGMFTITHYCPCEICCGKTDGITKTGTIATENRTIAVDPTIIPLGTEVEIDGQRYVAEDTGGAINNNKIDIFVATHEEAITRGKIEREVFIYE